MSIGTREQYHYETSAQLGASPANMYYDPHSGELHSFLPIPGVRRRSSVSCPLMNLHIKTLVTYEPDISCRPSADCHVAQNSHHGMIGWHSQTTQSPSAHTRQTNWQAVTPPREAPSRNVRTPVKYVRFTHCPSLCIAGSVKSDEHYNPTVINASLPACVMSIGDVPPTDTSAREETGSKKSSFVTEPCLFF